MEKYTQVPPVLLARAISLFLKGNVTFPKDLDGSTLKEGEEKFLIFRKVVVTNKDRNTQNQSVILKVIFHFRRFTFKVNRFLSIIPIPFIIAQPGFKSKTWMTGRESGTFYGLYEWDNIENAKRYLNSFPLKLMKKRAIPETLKLKFIENDKGK